MDLSVLLSRDLLTPVLTAAQIAIAIWLFARMLPKRERFWRRVAVTVTIVLVFMLAMISLEGILSLPLPPMIPREEELFFVGHFVTFSLVIILCLGAVILLFDTTVPVALFCVTAGYIMQNIASSLDGLMKTFLSSYGMSVNSWQVMLVGMVGLCAIVYLVCYYTFISKIERNGYTPVRGGAMMGVMTMVVFICLAFDLANKCYLNMLDAPARVVVIYRVVHVVVCILTLWMEFELLYSSRLEQDMAVMERMRSDEAHQYEASRRNIDAINVKCHDIRHQIRHLEQDGMTVDRGALDDLAREVRIYDSAIKTGNEALDVILTEKGLVCEREGIRLTCMADGNALSFMTPADLYSLFGNTLDNAIEAVRQLPDSERSISLLVSRKEDIVTVHEENYFHGDVEFIDGLPVTHKADTMNHGIGTRSMRQTAERYDGTLTMKALDGVFAVNMIMPVSR